MVRILANQLGSPASAVLEDEQFKDWPVERSVEQELEVPILEYVYPKHGLELLCDPDDRIHTIFLKSDKFVRFDKSVLDVPFSSNRQQVLESLGQPSRSGKKRLSAILGERGPWDQFTRPGYAIHVEYPTDSDHVKMITLMRADMVP